MRFAIMGSGGLGCLFGGVLGRAGVDVTLVARGANLAALRERGLEVKCMGGAIDVAEFPDEVAAAGASSAAPR